MNRINTRILLAAALLIVTYYAGLFISQMVVSSSVSSVTGDEPVITEEVVVTKPPAAAAEPAAEESAAAAEPTAVEEPEENDVSIESFYADAEEAYQNRDWQKAIADFESVTSLNEEFQSDRVKAYLASAYFNAGKESISSQESGERSVETALAQFRKAMSISPDDAEIREATDLLTTYSIGLRALRLGSFQQAVDILLPLYDDSPDYLSEQIGQQLYKTYLEIGDRAMRKRNTQVGIDFFNRAKAVNVADSSAVDARIASLEKVKIAQATPTPTPTPTPIATATIAPTATNVPVAAAAAVANVTPQPTTEPARCPDQRAVLISPANGEVLQGFVPIFGTAINEEFWYYKLEFASELSSEFKFIFREDFPVPNGRLAYWNTTLVPNGVYKLRLVVVEPTGNFPEPCEVTIQIKNAEQS